MSVRVAMQTPEFGRRRQVAVKTFADLASAAADIAEFCRVCMVAGVSVRVEQADDWPDTAAATAELVRLLEVQA